MLTRVSMYAGLCALVIGSQLTMTRVQAEAKPSAAAAKADSGKADAKEGERRKPLPAHYGAIGISDKQRTEIYAVQDQYEERLQKLRDELKSLVAERDEKLEQKLTDDQKHELKELRAKSKAKSEAKAKQAKAEK